jgi:hypothetical protein
MGGFDMRDAIEGWVLADGGFGGAVFVLRPSLFSDVYMTATFVLGEFIVPVSDQPMARYFSKELRAGKMMEQYLDWGAPSEIQACSAFSRLFVLQLPFSQHHHRGFAQSGRCPS